jgi:hypothetical protein
MKMITVRELGAQLPVGFPQPDGSLAKAFTLRPYKSRIDRHIGHWEEANRDQFGSDQGKALAMKVAKFVSLIVESVGGKPLALTEDGDSPEERQVEIAQWAFADVLYVYFFARINSLGEQLSVDAACSACGTQYTGDNSLIFDLREADVRLVEKVEEMDLWYEVRKPFRLRDKKTMCKSVRIAPMRWVTMMQPGVLSGSAMGQLGYRMLADSICGVNNDGSAPYDFTDQEMDEVEKIDRVAIDRLAEQVGGGLSLRTVVTCDKKDCAQPISNPLNWSWDHFFGESVPLAT